MRSDASEGILLGAGEGEAVTDEAARTVLIKTAHAFLDATWSRYEPGERGPDPHLHERHVDVFFVLAGELLFELGSGRSRGEPAGAGTLVAVPPGVVHTFGNEGAETATFLNFHAPSCGFADSLRGRDSGFDGVDPPFERERDPGDAIVCPLAEAERYSRDGVTNTILLELTELSANAIALGGGFAVAPHEHDDHLDAFYVLAGEVRLTLGESEEPAPAGTWIAAPPGVRHGLRGTGPGRAHLLNVHAPDTGFSASLRRRLS
jgi:quercetin dioxygenase-like cupin family protein